MKAVWAYEDSKTGTPVLKITGSVYYVIFEGKSINVWYDPWLNGKGLRAALGRDLLIWGPPLSTNLSVLIQNGKWTKRTRWHSTLDSLWDEIQQLEVGGSGPDILIWPLSRSDLIWQPMQSQRHSFCSWQFFHYKLPTRDRLLRKGLVQSLSLDPLSNSLALALITSTLWSIWQERNARIFKDRGGYGALLRDSTSNFIVGISGRSSLLNLLELQGIVAGLSLGIHREFKRIWFETNSTTVLAWIRGKGTLPWTAFKLMRKFSLEVRRLEEWKISHIFREGNCPADILASRCQTMGEQFVLPHQIGGELEAALLLDRVGTSYQRTK
ncbi:hypothetical protein QJS04_geneDACA016278 [Acorus gramineus]|uniref:RNase H type-1 domain-containing protein n=1 Tax=Acorus gramineus TaxID=55184 RepID=A0AAV8ZXC0_ACOGR|nr:hypothetical protein QJS04_geneDACA016278 [Acorus gramineus]